MKQGSQGPRSGEQNGAGTAQISGADDAAALLVQRDALRDALKVAEAALADIGDADREPGDDVAWCERRAAQALPTVRSVIAANSGAAHQPLSFDDALKIARGCTDYGGGFRGTQHEGAYQAGIQTVINALTNASKNGLSQLQTRVLHTIGGEAQ